MAIDGRNNEGGYSSLKRLSKDYHHLLRTLLSHFPPAKPFTITQYLIRIIGDLNEQLPSLPVPDDPRGIFYILKQLDDAVVQNLRIGGVSQTERVRLRNELERGRGIVAETFEGYEGVYEVEEVIGRVYERSLEEMEEPFGVQGQPGWGLSLMDVIENEGDRLQENILDDVDLH
jgi:Subunit 11 of the general transcription factor TFIIH